MSIDPVTLEIIANRLDEIQQVMKQRLFRTGYSTILRESFDGSAGLTTADGRLIGASGASFHTVPYSRLVQWIVRHFGPDNIHPGDAFISNDPYKGCSAHTPDLGSAAPVFVDGKLVAFCTSMGHKPDIGGIAPSTASAASRSIYHEGLLVPPIKLYERGVLNVGVRSLLTNNSRTPDLLIGDIEGQVGCTRVGTTLLEELCRKYTVGIVTQAFELLMDSAEKRLRIGLAQLPDGVCETENWLDTDSAGSGPIRIHVRVTKQGDSIEVDLTQSDPQRIGPANAVEQVCRAGVIGAVLAFVDHTIPLNDGVMRAIAVKTGSGLVVSPVSPAPVNSYVPTVHILFNCVTQALGRLCPERAFADSGMGLGGFAFGYQSERSGESRVEYELLETALGGTSEGDGASMVFAVMIYQTVEPIEIVESEFPVLIREFSIRRDSAGPGEHRGGLGYCREWEVLQDCTFSSRTSHRKFGGQGIAGGKAPKLSRTLLNPGRADEQVLEGLTQIQLKAGDRIRVEQSGGGGWGDPRKRNAEAVLLDVQDGYISVDSADVDYGRKVVRQSDGRYALADETQASPLRSQAGQRSTPALVRD
jgi:N-methylhydantoinase B